MVRIDQAGELMAAGKVHLPDGILPSGNRVRAVCACGWVTNPRVDDRRALKALEAEHGHSAPVCRLCGRDHTTTDSGRPAELARHFAGLRVLTDPETGEQFLVCRIDERACRDRAAQRLLHETLAALDGLGVEMPAPVLRRLSAGGER